MKKNCLIYANCQNALIAKYLNSSQLFNQEYTIEKFPVNQLMQTGTTIPDRVLQQAKLFIYQPVKNIHGDLSTESILNKLPIDCQRISFPPLYFTGYYPQYCKNPTNKVIKPNHPFGIFPHGDSNIIKMMEEGKSVAEIVEKLSDSDFYSRDFLLDNVDNSLAELARRESELNIKVSEFIKAQYQHHYLFYTQNHPSDILAVYVVNQILNLINLPELEDALSLENPMKGTLDPVQIPIYPSVIKHLNLAFVDDNTAYKHDSFCTNKMTFARYISEYVDLHRSVTESANSHYFQGIKFANQNELDRAAIALKNAIKLKSDNAAYYKELADTLRKQKKLDSAEIVYKKAIELSPDWIDFYISLSHILIEKDDLDAAVLTSKQAITLDSENDKLYNLLGTALIKQGNLEPAQTAYEKAIELNPHNFSYYRCMGEIYRNQSNLELAIVNYQKAIALAPDNVWLYIRLLKTLSEHNKLDEAVDLSQQVMQFKCENPSFYFQLGNLQISIGDVENALDSYQKAIEINTSYTHRVFAQIKNLLREKANSTVKAKKEREIA